MKKLGALLTQFYAHLLDLDHLIAIFPGDDMGFRTATLIAPNALRKYCLPWHKRFADPLTQELANLTDIHDRVSLSQRLRELLSGKQKFKKAVHPEARRSAPGRAPVRPCKSRQGAGKTPRFRSEGHSVR